MLTTLRRDVAQLLTLMDGFDDNKNIVVIAATNRPQDVDNGIATPWTVGLGD